MQIEVKNEATTKLDLHKKPIFNKTPYVRFKHKEGIRKCIRKMCRIHKLTSLLIIAGNTSAPGCFVTTTFEPLQRTRDSLLLLRDHLEVNTNLSINIGYNHVIL